MGLDFHIVVSWGFTALLAGLALGYLLYYRYQLKRLSRRLRRLILLVRAILIASLILLIMDLSLQWTRSSIVPPQIGIYLDNSLSMDHHPTTSASTVYSLVQDIYSWAASHDYRPEVVLFGEQITSIPGSRFEYAPQERLTDFNLLEEQWQGSDLAAAFIISDGVATSGKDPGALLGPPQTPLFTIGIGDTTVGLDLSLSEVKYPLSLLEQEQSAVEITVRGSHALGRKRRLFVFHEDELIYSKQISFESPEYVEKVEVKIVGRMDAPNFRVELEVLSAEANIENNRREFWIDVLPGQRRILQITGTLSPNTTLLSKVISGIRQASVQHFIFLRGKWMGGMDRFWRNTYDVVLFDNFPPVSMADEQLNRLLAKLEQDGTPVLVFEGPNSKHRSFARMLRSLGVRVQELTDADTLPRHIYLQDSGLLRTIDNQLPLGEPFDLPPARLNYLIPPEQNTRLYPILMDESRALVAGYGRVDGLKRSVVLLPALATCHIRLLTSAWRQFWPHTIYSLVEWALEPEQFSPFVVQPDRRTYHLGEKVVLRGLMRDRSGAKMLQPVLTLEIEGPSRVSIVTMNYDFTEGEYAGEFWPGEAGYHRYQVLGEAGEEITASGSGFHVQSGRVELEYLAQNRYSLNRLADRTGGQYVHIAGVPDLLAGLEFSPKSVIRVSNYTLWKIRFFWVVLVAALALEWIFRRIAGLI